MDIHWIKKKSNPMDLDLDKSNGYPISIHPLGTLSLPLHSSKVLEITGKVVIYAQHRID
jgi:hypothetical protein